MGNMKKAVDQNTLSREVRSIIRERDERAISETGVFGDLINEGIPRYIKTPSEIEYANQSGASIILGKDRMGSRMSGYGGKGDTTCGSVDIVVNRLGYKGGKSVDKNNKQAYCDSSAKLDGARLYISAKADIDDYFKLADGSIGNSKTKSAICAKADEIRLVSRQGIKIISTSGDAKNSLGGDINQLYGVDIMAGNSDEGLEPMVKGDSMVEAMNKMVSYLDQTLGLLDSFLHIQLSYNSYIQSHFHTSPFFAVPNMPSQTLIPEGIKANIEMLTKIKKGIVTMKTNLAGFKINYLSPAGAKYVCSRSNNVN